MKSKPTIIAMCEDKASYGDMNNDNGGVVIPKTRR